MHGGAAKMGEKPPPLVLGVALNERLWVATSAYTEVDFRHHMEDLDRLGGLSLIFEHWTLKHKWVDTLGR
jgi:hypothetical protein